MGLRYDLEGEVMMVRTYRCDIPMARKKGLLRICNKRCSECVAAITMGPGYIEAHVPLQDERGFSDPKLVMRNMTIYTRRTLIDESKRLLDAVPTD